MFAIIDSNSYFKFIIVHKYLLVIIIYNTVNYRFWCFYFLKVVVFGFRTLGDENVLFFYTPVIIAKYIIKLKLRLELFLSITIIYHWFQIKIIIILYIIILSYLRTKGTDRSNFNVQSGQIFLYTVEQRNYSILRLL